MSKNMGSLDRVLRIIVGLGLIVAAVLGVIPLSSWLGIGAVVVGGVFVVTALVSWCPLYRIFGLRTCKLPQA